jgi:hypothetical protein
MVDSVGNGSSVYGNALLRVGGSIRERLLKKLESKEAPKALQTAEPLKLPAPKPAPVAALSEEIKAKEFGGDQIAELLKGAAEPEPSLEAVAESTAEPEAIAPFRLEPGAQYVGTWGDGKIKFPGGEGRYFVEPGYQTIKFEFGGYTGHMLSPTKALAYNSETQQIVTFDVSLGEGEFKLSNISNVGQTPSDPRKVPDFEGKIDGQRAKFSNGMQIEFKDDGRIRVLLGDPNAPDKGYLEGDGFIDDKGNLVAMFQNGAAISAKYVRGENSFDLYNYSVLKNS